MLSPQGAVRLWKNLRFLLFLHPMFQNLKKNLNKTRRRQRKKCKIQIGKYRTCPSSGEEDSIFIEIPKPKAKETVSLDPNPNSYPSKLPYPERMKVREHDKPSAQHSRFLKMFKQLRLEIGLKDALVEMPKFNKMALSSLLRNKDEAGRSSQLRKDCALADSGASINLFTSFIYMILELEALTHYFEWTSRACQSFHFSPDGHSRGLGKDELVYYADKSEKNKEKNFVHAISVIDFSKDDPFSGSTTTHSDDPSPSSSPVKIDDVFCPPEDDNDEIDDFLAIEVSSNLEEGYFDSEGDIAFLDNLLSDDDSHNLDSKVTSDHEPEQNESSITFSPRSDPLHHEFAGEPLTLPARNNREFEEYLSLMTVLNEISTSQGNFHQNSVIESLPMSPILVEDSEPTQEEIDILLVPDNLIPPGVEDADSEDEVNESPNLDHQDDPSIPRPPPEPPDIEKCFEPKAGILIIKEFKGVSKSHDFMTSIIPPLFSDFYPHFLNCLLR
ncbi:hypothetical protein Tco_0459319 [Tanacetum coccineum]